MNPRKSTFALALKTSALVLVTLAATTTLSGCLVAGVSSSGGAFIWPGGLGLLLIVLLVIYLLRRR